MNRTASNDRVPHAGAATTSSRWLRCGALAIWPGRRLVRVGDRTVRLTVTQMAILMALVGADGEPVPRAVLAELCGRRHKLLKHSRTVDTMIFAIRQQLGDDARCGRIIVTVPSSGYAIQPAMDAGVEA